MRTPRPLLLCLLLLPFACAAQAPEAASPQQAPYTLQTGARLVQIPATVSIKGKILYGLKAGDFQVTDDGTPRTVTLDSEADAQGLSLVVLLQCSRSAVMEYGKIEALPTMVENLVGGAPHEVALVRYGAAPELVQPFTRHMEKVNRAMSRMGPCEGDKAATMDAVSYAASILENRPVQYRRAVLLVSETRDHGSSVKERDVVAMLGRSNITVDSVAYSPYRDDVVAGIKSPDGSGPFGLIIESMMAAVQSMRNNAPKTLAALSGGDYINFESQKGFENGVANLTNRIHNYYLLSFPLPADVPDGLHVLRVSVPLYPNATVRARHNYFAGPLNGQ